MAPTPIAIIAGVGAGTGSSVARRFAKAYPVALLARKPSSYEPLVQEINSSGGKAYGFTADVSDAASLNKAFEAIKAQIGGEVSAAAAIFNAQCPFEKKPFLETSEEKYLSSVNIAIKGGFLFAQATLPLLLAGVSNSPYPPTLIYTGATASIKSSAQMFLYSTGKHALRALALSVAKEFGPQGVHVVHAIIDGVIDIPSTKEWMKDAPPDAKINSDGIAEAYWNLHIQHRSAFTNEVDIRPYCEKW